MGNVEEETDHVIAHDQIDKNQQVLIVVATVLRPKDRGRESEFEDTIHDHDGLQDD